jgi:hypothetical protein
MTCERCRQRDALLQSMNVFGNAGAFCANCVRDLLTTFYDRHPEVMAMMPPELTTEQLVDGQMRVLLAGLSSPDPASPH